MRLDAQPIPLSIAELDGVLLRRWVRATGTSGSRAEPSKPSGLAVRRAVLLVRRTRGDGEGMRHLLSREDVVVGVNQLDFHLVQARGEIGYVDGIVVARIRPPPGQVINNNVQMPDAWRYLGGARPERLYDTQVLHAVLGPVEDWTFWPNLSAKSKTYLARSEVLCTTAVYHCRDPAEMG